MKTRTFPAQDRAVSEVGLGCWQLGSQWGAVSDAQAAAVLDVARQAGVEQLEEARHQLQFAHTLFWHTESCVHPGRGQSFPYPSADPGKSRFSGSVLSGFPQQFFCKDYLFLNTDFVSPVAWLGTLRWVLLAMLLLLVGTLLWLAGSHSSLETANDAHSG